MAVMLALAPLLTPVAWLALVVPSLWAVAVAIRRYWRSAKARRALQPLVVRAHAALAPHELGRADLEGSAFRAVPIQGDREGSRPRRKR